MNLAFYPQMKKSLDYYTKSPFYCRERILTIEEFQQDPCLEGGVVILGRTGNFHHYDLHHIKMLRGKNKIPHAENTTLVLFDWHEDLDHDPKGTDLTPASWAYLGLEQNLYSNLYVVGTNPRGFNEMNPYQYEEEIRPTTEELLKRLDRICLFPIAESFCCLKFFPEYEHFLANNESVVEYFIVKEGGFVQVRFRSMKDVSYKDRREAVIVSIDLDVLKKSVIKADCPQGVMNVDELLVELRKLHQTGPIVTCLICGLTESESLQDETSMNTLSTMLAECSRLLAVR